MHAQVRKTLVRVLYQFMLHAELTVRCAFGRDVKNFGPEYFDQSALHQLCLYLTSNMFMWGSSITLW